MKRKHLRKFCAFSRKKVRKNMETRYKVTWLYFPLPVNSHKPRT